MEYIDVEPYGLRVSRAALGTMTFGDQTDEFAAAEMLETCAAAGVTVLDTANSYSAGAGEETLGRLLPYFAEQFLIIGKTGGQPNPDVPELPPLSASSVRRSVEGSLRRLGRDHLDIFLLHHPDDSTPIAETLSGIGELLHDGKIRSYGASNFAAWRYSEFAWTARELGLPAPVFSELPYNLLSRRLEDEFRDYSEGQVLQNVVFNPLAGGLLTGKYNASRDAGAGGRFISDERGRMYQERYWNENVFEAVSALSRLASDAGLTLIELSLRWLLTRPFVSCILLGASRPSQLASNLSAIDGEKLPVEILQRCDEIWAPLHGAAPRYGH